MKLKSILPLLFLLPLAGPVLAESCPLIGPLDGTTAECRARRSAFRVELHACIDRKHAEADARSGRATQVNSHTNRVRFKTCDAEVRVRLGLASK